jgi:hypothetical protein
MRRVQFQYRELCAGISILLCRNWLSIKFRYRFSLMLAAELENQNAGKYDKDESTNNGNGNSSFGACAKLCAGLLSR